MKLDDLGNEDAAVAPKLPTGGGAEAFGKVFTAFADGFTTGKLMAYFRSEPVMAPKGTQMLLGYKRIVAAQFQELVVDNDDDVLVMFVSEDQVVLSRISRISCALNARFNCALVRILYGAQCTAGGYRSEDRRTYRHELHEMTCALPRPGCQAQGCA
jgi:hypothetical protein